MDDISFSRWLVEAHTPTLYGSRGITKHEENNFAQNLNKINDLESQTMLIGGANVTQLNQEHIIAI